MYDDLKKTWHVHEVSMYYSNRKPAAMLEDKLNELEQKGHVIHTITESEGEYTIISFTFPHTP